MSAYVVEDITINRVLSYLSNRQHYNAIGAWAHDMLTRADAPGLQSTDDLIGLGRLMRSANVSAVQQRYNGRARDLIPTRLYKFATVACGPHQALKSLRCWLYQCSEGDVPSSSIYKTMETIADQLAMAIIGELPQYEAAEWG